MTPSAARDRRTPALSVIVCALNRCARLASALRALVDQDRDSPDYEIIVVDNNSTDRTSEVIDGFHSSGILHAVFEPRQGLSFARNRGVAAASSHLLAFTDDDVGVDAAWVKSIIAAFDARPEADMIGGKVIPEWEGGPPEWLAAAGYAPLAIVDYGDDAFAVSRARPVCVIGANVAVRRRAFARAGGFSATVQRVGDAIGSTEDSEFQARVVSRGGTAVYDPRLLVPCAGRRPTTAQALSPRVTLRARPVLCADARSVVRMLSPDRARRPSAVYRGAVSETAQWAASLVTRRRGAAFVHELRLRFLLGFAVQRISPRT